MYNESYRDPCYWEGASAEQWQIYSLACVIYECATLKSHFNYANFHCHDRNPFLAEPLEFPSDFDADLRSLLSQMMSKTPSARPNFDAILE